MTVSTAALLQSLKTSAKQAGVPLREQAGQEDGRSAQEFLNLLQGLRSNLGSPENVQSERDAVKDEAAATVAGNQDAGAETEGRDGTVADVPSEVSSQSERTGNLAAGLAKVLKDIAGGGEQAQQGGAVFPTDQSAQTLNSGFRSSTVPMGSVISNGSMAGSATPASTAPNALADTGKAADADNLFSKFAVPNEERVNTRGTKGTGQDKAADSQTPAAGSVKILRQETHFAPTMRLSPVQQIGERLILSLSEQADPGPRGLGAAPVKTEGPVLKTLEIQLTPIELGSVKVSLRLIGENVEVIVKASNPQTAELLKQDRQLLDQMLRSTGYKPDAITIQSAADDRPVSTPSAGQQTAQDQGAASGQGGAGFGGTAQQDGRGGGRSHGFNGDTSELYQDTNTWTENDAETNSGRNDGGVYL
ncbi:flagellar hook-length control protein FliK [Roseibium sp.]|uniref:flagellar hook-length control protein FliK n=1 Tax=Roseibium sp. TaxID=1936156 RepID=UPI003A97E7F2